MAWEDRPYYRDRSGQSTNPLMWLFTGSVPLFTAFGIRVRAHVVMLLYIGVTILLDWQAGYPLQARALSMGMLTLFVILHEFGHCFSARWLGGSADEVLIWPLGGLAMVSPPHRPVPTFLTAAAGPAVNVFFCGVTALGMHFTDPKLLGFALNPFSGLPPIAYGMSQPQFWFWWIFTINYILLLFNLLPIYPLDGGQMAQAVLWPMLGHFRSMMLSTAIGMAGSVMLAIVGLMTKSYFLAAVGIMAFFSNYQQRAALRDSGPEDWREGVDYNASIYGLNDAPPRRRKRLSRGAIKRARRIAQRETAERNRIDSILAKVSALGMNGLNWRERRTLRKATEKQRRQELELSKFQ
jgi:Zn-dependent protease